VELARAGVIEAVRRHDNATLFDWLVRAISYQGVSDAAAGAYLDADGCVTAAEIESRVAKGPSCSKLSSFWDFKECGYQKTKQVCNKPRHFNRCPLPRHELRNGILNQASYSLYLFMRDIADGDLVGWMDERLDMFKRGKSNPGDLGHAVLEPLTKVYGISSKIVSMNLASLLLAGDIDRPIWIKAGASMIAVDTLVHNWFYRTGILQRCAFEHPYGSRCYGPEGCSRIIQIVSGCIDARKFNRAFPKLFPRFVQKAIWRFCAQDWSNQCNGNRIDDRDRCQLFGCPLYGRCERIALNKGQKQ
jgi:hypothetical protein